MTNDNIRLFPHDHLLKRTVLPFIPAQVLPNHLTVLRFFLTPFVLVSLWREDWVASLALFLFAAFTDALDGSLARVRRQITQWGTVADPVADKLLIGSVVVVFVAKEVNPIFAALIIFIELLIILGALYRRKNGRMMSANQFGKMKMLFQVLGVSVLLVAKLLGMPLGVDVAVGTLTIAIVFAVVSLLTYGF